MNKITSKAVRLVRGAALALSLAVMLSLMLALAAGAAEAAKTKSLKAGVQNTVRAVTSMVGSVAHPGFVHENLLSLVSHMPWEYPADSSLRSELWTTSPISISGRDPPKRGRGAIPLKPSLAAEEQKPSPAP